MRYTKKNVAIIEDISLHDYEMLNVEIDYFQKSLEIELKSPQGKRILIKTKRLYYLIVEGNEPWGEGGYVHELKPIVDGVGSELGLTNKEVFGIYILVNSGDKIILYTKELEFQET